MVYVYKATGENGSVLCSKLSTVVVVVVVKRTLRGRPL